MDEYVPRVTVPWSGSCPVSYPCQFRGPSDVTLDRFRASDYPWSGSVPVTVPLVSSGARDVPGQVPCPVTYHGQIPCDQWTYPLVRLPCPVRTPGSDLMPSDVPMVRFVTRDYPGQDSVPSDVPLVLCPVTYPGQVLRASDVPRVRLRGPVTCPWSGSEPRSYPWSDSVPEFRCPVSVPSGQISVPRTYPGPGSVPSDVPLDRSVPVTSPWSGSVPVKTPGQVPLPSEYPWTDSCPGRTHGRVPCPVTYPWSGSVPSDVPLVRFRAQ
eukprot:gene11872-14977_t